MMTDELREELAQAATATRQAYAVGSRNLSLASSTTAARGMNMLINSLHKTHTNKCGNLLRETKFLCYNLKHYQSNIDSFLLGVM